MQLVSGRILVFRRLAPDPGPAEELFRLNFRFGLNPPLPNVYKYARAPPGGSGRRVVSRGGAGGNVLESRAGASRWRGSLLFRTLGSFGSNTLALG